MVVGAHHIAHVVHFVGNIFYSMLHIVILVVLVIIGTWGLMSGGIEFYQTRNRLSLLQLSLGLITLCDVVIAFIPISPNALETFSGITFALLKRNLDIPVAALWFYFAYLSFKKRQRPDIANKEQVRQ